MTEGDARWRQTADCLPQPVWTCSATGACDYLNARWVEYTGVALEPQLGSGWLERVHPVDRPRLEDAWRRAVDTGTQLHMAFRIRRHDGAYRWFDTRAVRVRDEQGAGEKWFASSTDIHEQYEFRETLPEAAFMQAFRSGPVALTIRRLDDRRFVEVNDAFLAATGLQREEVIGRNSVEIGLDTPERVREREALLARRRRADGSVKNIELPFATKTGELRIALASLEHLTFGSHGPCVLSTFIDITEGKLAERRLALQHAVSSALAESVSLVDAAPRIIRAVCETEGWDIGAIWKDDLGKGELRCINLWHRPVLEGSELVVATRALTFAPGCGVPGRVWATGEPLVIPDVSKVADFTRADVAKRAGLSTAIAFPIVHAGQVIGVIDFIGTPHPLDSQLHALLGDIGQQIGLFVARSRAAATTRRSEERLNTVIENLSEGLILADGEGKIFHWNPSALAIHGFERAEDWTRALADFQAIFELRTLAGTVVPFSEWPLARVLRGEAVRDYELHIFRLGSDWHRAFSFGGSLVPQPDGTKLAIVTMNDITERLRRDEIRRRSEELTKDNRRMREQNRLKSEFLANMSHELRTPLNAIIGFASLLHSGKAGPMSETQSEYLGDVLTSSRHLLQLLNDVLDLAKVESGRMDVRVEEVELAKTAAEVKDILRGLAAEKKIGIAIEIEPPLSRVIVDVRLLKQVLYNYLSNAIKFTPERGQVKLCMKLESDTAFRIDVEDTGIGVKSDDLSKLFVEFQQLDAGSSKRYAGTGLGLALTKRIAEAQGGTVGVVSELGKGSTFSVILPRVVQATPLSDEA